MLKEATATFAHFFVFLLCAGGGRALWVVETRSVSVIDCTFNGLSSDDYGAAVAIMGTKPASITMADSFFTACSVKYGPASQDHTISVVAGSAAWSETVPAGGAVFVHVPPASMSVTNCTFEGNTYDSTVPSEVW